MKPFKLSDSRRSCDGDLRERAIKIFGEDAEVIYPRYSDYGGSFLDRVVIEYYKSEHPEHIIYETTDYHGQAAICKLIDGRNPAENRWCELDDTWEKLSDELLNESAENFCKDNNCMQMHADVVEWMEQNGGPQPTAWDYSPSALEKFVAPKIVDAIPYFAYCSARDKFMAEMREEMEEKIQELERKLKLSIFYEPEKTEGYEMARDAVLSLMH